MVSLCWFLALGVTSAPAGPRGADTTARSELQIPLQSQPADSSDARFELAPNKLDAPGSDRIELPVPGRATPATCWVHRPAGYRPGARPPLIVCLHGTDDTAEQMIEFWRERSYRVPPVLAAPQGLGRGWSSDDVPAIQATLDYLQKSVSYDPHRVLLLGFSAGGTMVFQLLYHENVRVSAAAALANYVPPTLTLEQVRSRKDVPVFYAVGMSDINHGLMRAGLEFLRSAGANVELFRPDIGHTLDPRVAQATIDWFYTVCDRQTDAAIEAAARGVPASSMALRVEEIAAQPDWFSPLQVERAARVLEALEKPGRELMRDADRLAADDQVGPAVELYLKVESDHGIGRLAGEARTRRERLESDAVTRERIRQFVAGKRAEQAMSEYARAQRLVAQHRLADAAEVCRRLVDAYGDTPAALRAERLLNLIDGRTRP